MTANKTNFIFHFFISHSNVSIETNLDDTMHSHFLHSHRHSCNRCHDLHSRKWHLVRMDCANRTDDGTNHRNRLRLKNNLRSGCISLYNLIWCVRVCKRFCLFFVLKEKKKICQCVGVIFTNQFDIIHCDVKYIYKIMKLKNK